MNNIFPTRPTVRSSLPCRSVPLTWIASDIRRRGHASTDAAFRYLYGGWRRKNKLIMINPCVDGNARRKSQPGQPADPVEVEEVLLLHQLWATIAASVVLGRTGSIDIASETLSLCLLFLTILLTASVTKKLLLIDYLLFRRCRRITNCTIEFLHV